MSRSRSRRVRASAARLIALLAIVAVALSPAPRTAAGAAPVTLKFWDMVWGPPEYITSAKQLVSAFNASHPTIHVEYQSIPWTNWYQTFATAVASGAGPDVSTGAAYQPFQFAAQGYILPVDSIIATWEKSGILAALPSDVVHSQRYQGHQIGIPWSADVRVFYYRKDLFKKAGIAHPPATWAELRADARKLTDLRHGQYGFGMPGDTMGEHYLLTFMLNNGGGLFSPSGQPDLGYARNVEAITFLVDMAKDGSIDPAGAGWQNADMQKAFGAGHLAMIVNTPGLQNYYPPQIRSQIGLMDPLKGPHGDYGTIKWIASLMIYKETKDPEAAKTFVAWMALHQLPFWTQGHSTMLPVRTSFAAARYFAADPYATKILKEWLPIGKYTGARSTTLFPQLNAVEGQGFMQKMAQQVILGQDPKVIIAQGAASLADVMKNG